MVRDLKQKLTLIVALVAMVGCGASAQKWALKSNLLYDATTTINIGVEAALSQRLTLDISGNYNPWTFSDNKKWKHWLVQPELRYWFCRKWNGHFIAVHAHGGEFNFGNLDMDFKLFGNDFGMLKDYRYEGWFAGAGIAYGYSWILSKHWNLEAELGIGWAYAKYDQYRCPSCGKKEGSGSEHYFGPTKAALNVVYLF